jgi:hypothetical protein
LKPYWLQGVESQLCRHLQPLDPNLMSGGDIKCALKYTLFENGIDSFKSAYDSIEKIKDIYEGGYHHYKDAILSINHANEVLFKHMLKGKLELLIYDDMKAYIKAKTLLQDSGKNNVLEIDLNLKTVNLLDAMKRLRHLCDVGIPEMFFTSILYLNNLRNQIMHYEIDLDDAEVPKLRKMLESCYTLSFDFFSEHLDGVQEALENARYEISMEDISEIMAEQAAEAAHWDRMADEQADAANLTIDEALEDEFEGRAT